MKLGAAICVTMLLSSAAAAAVNSQSAETAAEAAALAWLGLVDAENYAQSWSSASTLFRQKVSESQWQFAVSTGRAPLGALQSREVESATLTRTLPGAPDGDYVVIRFASSFEHRANAVETVTPMKDTDGKWHVSGYYIK
jgi:hypothetical protein